MRLLKPFLLLLLVQALTLAQGSFDPEKSVSVTFNKGVVTVTSPPGTHLKQSFMSVELQSKGGKLVVGALTPPNAKDELGDAIWHGPVKIPLSGEGLKDPVVLGVTYQACTEGEGGVCYPPTTQTLTVKAAEIPAAKAEAKLTVTKAQPVKTEAASRVEATAPASPEPFKPTMAAIQQASPAATPPKPVSEGVLALLIIAFLAGLGASLTPCVYPMIPITMAIIGTKGGGKLRGFLLSLSLVLGMAVTYTALGVFAAMSGATFGSFAQKPAFLIPVSILFALFALSLFGLYEIDLPQSVKAKLQGDSPRKGFGGAFVMGLVLGPLAAPCVGPIVASILVGIAQQGQVFLGGLQLFVFALGMGVLFLLVGTFSAGLPRSGDWLTKLKYLMGVIVLGFAAWNIRLLAPEWLNAAMWMVVLLVAAVVLGAFKSAEELGASLQKALGLVLLTIGILLGVRAVEAGLDVQLLPKAGVTAKAEAGPQLWIENDLEAAQAKAKAERKLVLIDTYTSWCAQCKELDHKTWPNPQVAAWIQQNAIAVRVECEKARPDLQTALDIKSYPTVILQDAEGKELRRTFGFRNPEAMLAWLKGA